MATIRIIVFTFHNVSINTQCGTWWHGSWAYLHSTMFLLIRTMNEQEFTKHWNLHSTMFLLIQGASCQGSFEAKKFTFHNVSINTNIEILTFCRHVHLHSTMFLLIRTPKGCFACPFHNLHSTMFLLILMVGINNGTFSDIYIPQCFY